MDISLQIKIKNTKNYYKYLKENSFFFKELNRNPNNYKKFENFVKEKYRLKITDKLEDAYSSVELISSILKNIK